ncbi:MAG: UvrD-helicase domain-containing protein, partial [Desulfamplus sp.]|nr:UvrD-helicase domain-containing protein [Desulfamplus sp.]
MEFIADLHLHSHFSRATSKNLDLEHTYQAAMVKGITVVGTGDFTHPGWFKELKDKLEPAESGLFKLKDQIIKDIDNIYKLPLYIKNNNDNKSYQELDNNKVRFILQCEISSIYKKDGRVRKNHNLIYFSDMASVQAFNEKLGKIGNITSDGRPILGLDCEKLLEIMLETSEDAFMIPAHIWTPWFSMFGSKSGFNSVEECFGSLASHIFAVETGLSSDLPMNWRVENLDRMNFISCSDAHSPMFMGRNASAFNTILSYKSIRDALKQPYNKVICDDNSWSQDSNIQNLQVQKSLTPNCHTPNGYLGTIDMYPEEGKYHYDGHRKCNVCFNPSETLQHDGICPECGKPLTLGVLYRVQELASRPESYTPDNRHGYQSIIPLAEILSEICKTGTKTKKVDFYYTKAISTLGPELDILLKQDIDEIERAGIPLLSEAIRRMRNKEIHLSPGFDGEFGRVTVFTHEEKEKLKGDISMFTMKSSKMQSKDNKKEKRERKKDILLVSAEKQHLEKLALIKNNLKQENNRKNELNPEQQKAIISKNRPLLMEAGPGTGKTHTLTEKIASLIINDHVNPESILALTFTSKAAEEMTHRIKKIYCKKDKLSINSLDSASAYPNDNESGQNISTNGKDVFISTFHGFCLMVLKEYTNFSFAIADETLRKAFIKQAIKLAFPDNCTPDNTNNHKIKKLISSSKIELDIAMLKQVGSVYYDLTKKTDNYATTARSGNEKQNIILQVLKQYQELLSSYQLVDFDDLIIMVIELLQNNSENSEILSKLKNRFTHIFVDEYQDINKSQYELIRLIAGDGKNLCVIGDPDQSIYGFRGADNRYFKRFGQDYPDTEKIVFKRNYRSTETILEASFQLIRNSKEEINIIKDKNNLMHVENIQSKERLFSGIQGEQQIHILEAASEEAEAVMVGKTIERLVGGISMFSMDSGKADSSTKDEYSFSDIAILYRTKKQSEVLSKIFDKAGIPFQTADRDNIFLEKGIKELISCLRILIDRGTFYDYDILSAYKKSLNLTEFCNNSYTDNKNINNNLHINKNLLQSKNTAEFLKIMIDELQIEKVINKNKKSIEIADLLIKEAEKYPDPARFYEHITMKRDIDTIDYQAEKVALMTMHASKGLEFKVVFIVGCENGLIPFFSRSGFNHLEDNQTSPNMDNGKGADRQCEDIDEERRLFYVAMTRAEDMLYLCHAKKRQIFGKT